MKEVFVTSSTERKEEDVKGQVSWLDYLNQYIQYVYNVFPSLDVIFVIVFLNWF